MKTLQVQDFMEKMRQCDPEDQVSLFVSELGKFGYSAMSYGCISLSRRPDRQPLSFETYPREWMELYRERNYHLIDYTVAHCLTHDTPLLWSDVARLARQGALRDDQLEMLHVEQAFGVRAGVSIPISVGGGYRAGVGFCFDPDMDSEEHDRLFLERRATITALADIFHAHVFKGEFLSEAFQLSKREVEMLKWLSEGLQRKEISHKTGTHEETIGKQIQSAKKKLGARNTTQAVYIAAKLQLI